MLDDERHSAKQQKRPDPFLASFRISASLLMEFLPSTGCCAAELAVVPRPPAIGAAPRRGESERLLNSNFCFGLYLLLFCNARRNKVKRNRNRMGLP